MVSRFQARRKGKGGRLLCLLSVFTLLIVSLCSCASKKDDGITVNPVTYDYEQTLNIIDDNYRNYYEIFVYSFYDSDGDGIGDLNGVIEKLDYIADMGFNGIWLMPIMPSPTYHKYDVTDYYGIDSKYGTVEDFTRLAEECHNRGIRLVIDMVINHSSSNHAWFLQACSYLRTLPKEAEPDPSECPYVEYYHFSRERIDATYYAITGCDWYYEGSFWSEMPDLNLGSEALRQEFEQIAAYWIDLGVDGFRMDAALHFEEKDTAFNTETLNWLYEYCKGLNPDFYMVSEIWAALPTITDYYGSKTPSMFNFDAAGAEGMLIQAARGKYPAASLVAKMQSYENTFGGAYADYIDAPFLTNHDMNRVANALMNDGNSLKMACGLMMMMNGSPFVYYGEEIGMASKGTADENKRIAMYWSDTDTEGMTKGPADADVITSGFAAVDEQLADGTSILNYYKRALRLRNENPEIARGSITLVESLCEEHQAAILKTWQESTIGIVYNTSDEEIQVILSGTELADMQIRGYLTLNGEIITLQDGVLTMPAQSICVLK
ncbi:MAG: alpha amylase [Lachnospiraceae bacterium]|nr:alpha amylase [Lachnospiraceae bacterium]